MNQETKKFYSELIWSNGVGDGYKTACVNSLAVLMDADRRGLTREQALSEFSDNSSCICPVIRLLSIRINDRYAFWPNAEEATAWMHATAPRLLDTRGSIELTRKRAYLCADAAIREIAPWYFDRIGMTEWADKLRAVEPMVNAHTSRAAQAVASEAMKAADAADADAYAAYASDADAMKPMLLALLDRLIDCKE